MSVPNQALNLLIEHLKQLAVYNPLLIADVKENIDKLQLELEFLKSVMRDLSRSDHGSSYLMQTMKGIRSVIDEAEDAVDGYIVLAAAQKSKGWVTRAMQPRELRDAGKQIADTAQNVNQINQEKIRTGTEALKFQSITQVHVSAGVSADQTKAPRVEGGRVIGFDDPKKRVKELLVHGDDNLQVITIAGMSGLGKSTLAKMVYNDIGVSNEFMIRAFVNISKQFNKKEVLLRLLTSVSGMNDDEVMKMKAAEELEELVCKQLAGEQYLIVLDDVWEPEDWDALKSAFPDNNINKRCRVLITTTNAGLAEYVNPANSNSLYLLDLLNVDDSKELLQCKVFGQEKFPDEIIEYVDEIVLKCDGLPFAIVLIAGILLDRRDIASWWKEVSGSVYNYLSRDASEGNKLVEMMYEHLPNKLKPCFIYLGVFGEDYEIPVWKLVRLWISEGFIEGGGKTNLEDIAEQYLEELVQRNLVTVEQRRSNGKIKTCRLHDALRDFCKKEAGEENLFQEVNSQNSNLDTYPSFDDCRRLSIPDSNIVDYIPRPVSGKRVRSFLRFQKEIHAVQPKYDSLVLKTFKLLKVLEGNSLCLDILSPDLGHLLLLKYLTISSDCSIIPSTLSGLWNLQTLMVTTTSKALKVEMDLWKLPHFRHFHTNSTATLPSPETKVQNSEGHLPITSVRTLCTISTDCCSRKVFDRTPKIKKLGICGDIAKLFIGIGDSDDKSKSKFGELRDLENLKLINAVQQSKLQSLPSHTCFPPQLTMLTLTNTRLEWKEMSKLGKLANLEVLKLKEFAFQGMSWETEEGGFVHLIHLYIGQTDLVSWEGASATTFPTLKTLKLNSCEKLKALPDGLAEIPSLQSLDLQSTNPQVAFSARRLQVLKLKQAGQSGDKNSSLRLSVSPPAHLESSP